MTTTGSRWNDNSMVERMSSDRGRRYPPEFWAFFESGVQPRIGDAPAIADLGCGPGLLLQDLASRLPDASMHGVDVSDAMLASARELDFPNGASFTRHDLNEAPYPVEDGSLDLCITANVVCFLDNPLVLLAEVRRMLRPGGVYLLYDWRRQALADYIEGRGGLGDNPMSMMGLQPFHNRFTTDEWKWLLAEGGFEVAGEAQPRISHVAIAGVPR